MGIDILVPVLGRPHRVQPLLESIALTETPHRALFVCSPNDHAQIEACQSSDAETLIVPWAPGKADFAKKINWAFDRTDSEWVFQGADDLRFHHQWDYFALMLAEKTQKQVIGTNDLHNPSVRRGLGSTHTLFSRSYIETHGGTTDGSGRVFCELYDHQFVDNEFVETAKQRGQWAWCKRSVVEHLHPHWGLAEMDATYKKAIRNTNADYRIFMRRIGKTLRNGRASRRRLRQESVNQRSRR